MRGLRDSIKEWFGDFEALIDDFKILITSVQVLGISVSIIVAAAFVTLVGSFRTDILAPLFNALIYWSLKPLDAFNPGNFIGAIVGFVVSALVVFITVRIVNLVAGNRRKELCPLCTSPVSAGAAVCPACGHYVSEFGG